MIQRESWVRPLSERPVEPAAGLMKSLTSNQQNLVKEECEDRLLRRRGVGDTRLASCRRCLNSATDCREGAGAVNMEQVGQGDA
jgi:hypothetical protein